jgi:hypothetical protein
MKALGVVCLAALNPWLLRGQSGDSEIVTDRPDITESAIVVPAASLQFENGVTWTAVHGSQTIDLSESLVRLGIFRKTEVRLGAPNFSRALFGIGESGFGDLSLGLKQQLGPLPGGVDLSVIAAVSLPSGRRGISSGGFDPFIKLPWSKELPGGWSFGGMQSLFWNTDNGTRNNVWEPTFYLERQITKPLDAFAEYAADYAQRVESKHVVHFGAAFKLNPANQLDLHFGFGLNHATPSRFFAVGYSFRIDRLWK